MQRKYLPPLLLAPILVMSCLLLACDDRVAKKKTEADISRDAADVSAALLMQIAGVYKKGDFLAHLQLTAGLLKYLGQHPQLVLQKSNEQLLEHLKADGVDPYLSLVIEALHRSAYAPIPASRNFAKEIQAVLASHDYKKKRDRRESVLLRTINRRGYRPYPANVGVAALLLMMSEYQREESRSSFAPETYARLASLIQICTRRALHEEKPRRQQRRNVCKHLSDTIAANFHDAQTARTQLDTVSTLMEPGITSPRSQCLVSIGDPTFQQMIDEFDQYTSCRANESPGGPPRFDPIGTLFEGDINQYYRDLTDADTRDAIEQQLFDKGYQKNGRKKTNIISGNDFGDPGWVLWTEAEYKDPSTGDTVTVSQQQDTQGNNYTRVITNHEDDGTSYIDFENGMPRSAGHDDPSTGESYRADFTANGTLDKETFTDANGNVTEVDYNDKGECIKNCTATGAGGTSASASTPLGEHVASECGALRTQKLREHTAGRPITKLDMLIIPQPDSVKPVDSPCFSQFADGGIKRCSSVAQCLEGYGFDENCQCQKSREAEMPFASSACSHITCAEGRSCDPATGLCMSSGGEDFDLGTVSPKPLPIIRELTRIGTDSNIKNMSERMKAFGSKSRPPQ